MYIYVFSVSLYMVYQDKDDWLIDTVNARSLNVERTGYFTLTSQSIQVISFNEKTLISNLVRIACFWNNLYQVRSKPTYLNCSKSYYDQTKYNAQVIHENDLPNFETTMFVCRLCIRNYLRKF